MRNHMSRPLLQYLKSTNPLVLNSWIRIFARRPRRQKKRYNFPPHFPALYVKKILTHFTLAIEAAPSKYCSWRNDSNGVQTIFGQDHPSTIYFYPTFLIVIAFLFAPTTAIVATG